MLPPLLVTLALAAVACWFGLTSGEIDARSLASQIFFFSNYYNLYGPAHEGLGGTGVLWSLAVEEHFYLLFPLLFILLFRGAIGIRHIEDFGVETVLLGKLLRLAGQRLGIPALARIQDRQGLPRLGGRNASLNGAAALGRFKPREEPGKPRTLLRSCLCNDLVQRVDVFRRKRSVMRKQWNGSHRRLSS